MRNFNFYIGMQKDGQYNVSRGPSKYRTERDTFVSADVDAVIAHINQKCHLPGHSIASSRFDLVTDEASRKEMGKEKVTELTDMLTERTRQIAGVDEAIRQCANGEISTADVTAIADKNEY